VVENVGGAVPQFEASGRVVKSGIIPIQSQVFGPELTAEVLGQRLGMVTADF